MRVGLTVEFPCAEVGIESLAAGGAIGTQRVEIVGAVLPGLQIVIFAAPRVFGQTGEIALAAPLGAGGESCRSFDQRLEALRGRWVLEIVELVEVERRANPVSP